MGKWKTINPGNRSESCSENSGFRIAQVVRLHSENGMSHSEMYFLNSESCSENTPERSQSSENGLFTPKGFFFLPKGPICTKNTTTVEKIVNYYAVAFLLRPPHLLRRGPFLVRKNVCNLQETGVCTRCAAIVNHSA